MRIYLASGSFDSTVKVWDLKAFDSAEPVTLRGHTGSVYSVAFSPDGRRLASAGGYADRGEVKVWDAALWQGPGKRGAFARTVKKLIRGLEAVEDWARCVLIGRH